MNPATWKPENLVHSRSPGRALGLIRIPRAALGSILYLLQAQLSVQKLADEVSHYRGQDGQGGNPDADYSGREDHQKPY